ncbi:MAG: hypothetical protein IKZ27_06360 [Kiritimatiellae bacterium]|nr:hypothetical protein [Kiritimatiellia bacterium]
MTETEHQFQSNSPQVSVKLDLSFRQTEHHFQSNLSRIALGLERKEATIGGEEGLTWWRFAVYGAGNLRHGCTASD